MSSIQVAAGLVIRDGKLLITQRPAGGHLAGLWEFPGGKREPGESFERCLQRELMEELGIEVEVLEEVESITHDYPEKSVHLRFFRCIWKQHEPQALGCSAFAWVTAEGLGQYQFPAADARLLQKLRNPGGFWPEPAGTATTGGTAGAPRDPDPR
jgi:mutator protein MutT